MSVRDGLLAILSLGPAYGFQLHAELTSRAPHRGPINAGQIYATLDRLTRQGLIASAGSTDDGLPLHALTAPGADAVDSWKRHPLVDSLPEWTEMLDQVILTTSIDPLAAMSLAEGYRRHWASALEMVREALDTGDDHVDGRLALLAREAQAVAAIAWLGSATEALAGDNTFRPPATDRPRRGRRPRHVAL